MPWRRRSASAPDAVDALTERRARQDLRRQIALLEKRLGELFASAFPRQGIEWTVGAVGGPRVLGVAELERVRDALAAQAARGAGRARAPGRGRGAEPRLGRGDDRRAPALPVGPGVQRGRRRARLPALAFAAALGHPRDADGLVAGKALLRLSVSQGAPAPARPADCHRVAEAPQASSAPAPRRRRRRPSRLLAKTPPAPRGAARDALDDERPRRPGARSRWSSSSSWSRS